MGRAAGGGQDRPLRPRLLRPQSFEESGLGIPPNGTLGSGDADGKVVAGAQVTISGTGFLPGSTVERVVYSTRVKLGTAVVLADGT